MSAAITPPATAVDVDFDAPVTTGRNSRFELGVEVEIGNREAVAIGADKKTGEMHVVHITGKTQAGLPVRVIGRAIASGSVITPSSVVAAFVKAGTLKDLEAAIAVAKRPAA